MRRSQLDLITDASGKGPPLCAQRFGSWFKWRAYACAVPFAIRLSPFSTLLYAAFADTKHVAAYCTCGPCNNDSEGTRVFRRGSALTHHEPNTRAGDYRAHWNALPLVPWESQGGATYCRHFSISSSVCILVHLACSNTRHIASPDRFDTNQPYAQCTAINPGSLTPVSCA